MKPLEEMGKFKTVVVDPPWDIPTTNFGLKRVESSGGGMADSLPYETLDYDAISKLPIGHCLDIDSLLFCWTVNQMLPVTFRLIDTWGCRYFCTMTWHKPGGPQFPNGPCYNSEWIVVGKKGSPKFSATKGFSLANNWPRGKQLASWQTL